MGTARFNTGGLVSERAGRWAVAAHLVTFGPKIGEELIDTVDTPSHVHDPRSGCTKLLRHRRVVSERFKEVHQGLTDLVQDGLEPPFGKFVAADWAERKIAFQVRCHVVDAFHDVGNVMHFVEHDEPPRC